VVLEVVSRKGVVAMEVVVLAGAINLRFMIGLETWTYQVTSRSLILLKSNLKTLEKVFTKEILFHLSRGIWLRLKRFQVMTLGLCL